MAWCCWRSSSCSPRASGRGWRRLIGLEKPRVMTALLSVDGVSKRFRGLLAVDNVSFRRGARARSSRSSVRTARARPPCSTSLPACSRPTRARSPSPASASTGCRPDEICRRGIGRTFQLVRPFPGADGRGQCHRRRDAASARSRRSARACARGAAPARPVRQARPAGRGADPARPQAARSRARACHRPEAAAARRGDGWPAADRDRPHGRHPARRSTARPG